MKKRKTTVVSKIEKASAKFITQTGKYIEAIGGKAVVGGGITIEKFSEENDFSFRVSVKITGQLPPKLT